MFGNIRFERVFVCAYVHIYTKKKKTKICLIPITPCFTSPFLKSISLLKRFKVRRLPSSREFHFCCMASAFASLWSNNELLLAYGKKHTSYLQVYLEHTVKQQYKISLQMNSSRSRWVIMYSFDVQHLFCSVCTDIYQVHYFMPKMVLLMSMEQVILAVLMYLYPRKHRGTHA